MEVAERSHRDTQTTEESEVVFEQWLKCQDQVTLQEFSVGYWYLWCPRCGRSRLIVTTEGEHPHICRWGKLRRVLNDKH